MTALDHFDFDSLRDQRIGLITHAAAVDRDFVSAAELFARHTNLTALFGPEHGFHGTAQDLIGVAADRRAAIPIHTLYGHNFASLKPTAAQLAGLDRHVIDLCDIGSRYYTFQATMLYCLEAAAEVGLPVTLLDRPNPLGGVAVEGPALAPGYTSFVGAHDMATRHGLTIGELAYLYRAERNIAVALDVVPCVGWRREQLAPPPWVLPSPNMPTFDTALVYPGQCLLEGTNLSEGRGTTRPFELCGFPGLDAGQLADRLTGERWPGVIFRPAHFTPTFQKHAGHVCGGVQLHVTDPLTLRPVRTGLAVLAALRDAAGERFAWRTEIYEFVRDPSAIDLLCGSDRERLALEAGVPVCEIVAAWEPEEAAFRARREPYLLY